MRDCTVISGRVDTAVVTDVFLLLAPGADAGADHGAVVREALCEPAAATLRRIVIAADGDGDIVLGPTGKVRKFLMRQRHLAGAGAP